MHTTLPHYLPHLQSAQGRGLALWVYGTTLAQSGCQNAVITALLAVGDWHDSSAIPVAWHVLPANQPGAWMPHILRLLRLLGPAVPPTMQVVVLADQGLSSPRLWKRIRDLRWHPMVPVHDTISFHPLGKRRLPARQLVPGPGHAWVCRGVAFCARPVRRQGTLVVVWAPHQERPWVVLTDVPPERVGICWYGLRVWIELGSRVLKGVG
jgi:hypothetical protein